MRKCSTYWNGNLLESEDNESDILIDNEDGSLSFSRDKNKHRVSVSKNDSGFLYVLAQPNHAERTVALNLDSNPRPGVYKFVPLHDEFEFSVRLEYDDYATYPDSNMHVLDVTTPLSKIEVGNQIEIGLREDETDSPGVKSVKGEVSHILDFSGLVPDIPVYNSDDEIVLSILVSLSDGNKSTESYYMPRLARQSLQSGPDSGTLDVIGSDHPLGMQWEGKSDTPALQVEFVRINPGKQSELTVKNESLPKINFDDITDYTQSERASLLKSILSRALDREIKNKTIEFFATAVGDPSENKSISVKYESSRSGNILTRSGTFSGTKSLYSAEENRSFHQLRFSGSDGYHYILLDPDEDSQIPAKLYSTSLAQYWDTELGPVVDFEFQNNKS
jgi:hypothetical protein